MAVNNGTPLACSRFYPLIIRTLEAWVELPHLRSRPAPPQGHHGLQSSTRLEDFSPAIIYSIPELKEFRQLLSYPTFQQARLAEILLGDCRHQTKCSLPTHVGARGSQTFDLNQLAAGITQEMVPAWWTSLDQRIRAWGTYISLLVLFIYLIQFLMWVFYSVRHTRVGSYISGPTMYNFPWWIGTTPLSAGSSKTPANPTPPKMLVAYSATLAEAHALSQVQPA